MSVTKIDGAKQLKFSGDLSLNSKKIINLANPVNAGDAVNKQYVDNMSIGLDVKPSVRVATTVGILTSGLQTIDGVTLVAGDRVLVKDQDLQAHEVQGIYIAASGAWSLSTDFATGMHVGGAFMFVEEGTVNGDNGFVCTANAPTDVVGTDSLPFVQFSGAGQIIAGAGISKSGNTISLSSGICTPGTYTKVTVDTYGRVTAGTSLLASDLPNNIDAAKIGTGAVGNTVFGYLAGASSNIQTQLNAKQATISVTANRALVSDGSGNVIASGVSTTELGYVSGVSSSIQTQLNAKLSSSNFSNKETPTGTLNGSNVTFTLAYTPVSGQESVFLNGILQDAGVGNDYTISGAIITMATAPVSDDKIRVSYFH